MVERRPAAIVRCSGVADVFESIRFAREHDLLIAVRGGGHNVAGFATCDGGLLIDLSPPDEINAAATFWTLPAALPFPPPFHGRDVVILNAIYISWARNDSSNIFRLNQNIT